MVTVAEKSAALATELLDLRARLAEATRQHDALDIDLRQRAEAGDIVALVALLLAGEGA